MKTEMKWYVRGGHVKRAGPFRTQEEAARHLRYSDEYERKTGLLFPSDVFVWPEER